MTEHSTNGRLPLWARIWRYAEEHADATGTALLGPGELRKGISIGTLIRPAEVSRALRTAESMGVLERGSSARCLVLPKKP